MKNFIRVLQFAWPYRGRIVASFGCALMAAILWGLNFTSIYPFLKTLQSDQAPNQWIATWLQTLNTEIDAAETVQTRFQAREKEIEGITDQKFAEKQLRELTSDQVRNDTKIQWLRSKKHYLQLIKKNVVDRLPDDTFQNLLCVVVAVIIAVTLKCLFEVAQDCLVGSVINRTIYDLRNRCFGHVIRQDVDHFNEQGSAGLMARFTNDMDSLSTGMKTLFGRVIAEPLRVVACILLACLISWQLTLMFLIIVPAVLLVLARIGRTMKRATRKLLERMSKIFQILQESFQSIRTVKIHTAEAMERRRFLVAIRDYKHRSNIVVYLDAIAGPIVEVLGVAAVACALLAGAFLVLRHETSLFGIRMSEQPMDPEALIQLYVLLAAVSDPVRKLSSVFTKLQAAWAASDRVFEILDNVPKIFSNPVGLRLETIAGNSLGIRIVEQQGDLAPWVEPADETPFLRFQEVGFSYHQGVPVLRDVSFDVKKGETIAIVGHNGCGKSTLFSLLPRFHDPDHGSIQMFGHDLRKYHLRSLRRMVGFVSQTSVLFDDSIFANICYGLKSVSKERVEEAARKAHAHEMILKLPMGYETVVGESGNRLSGGQRQRICLARTILRNPPILLLDEFTSQSDPESETLIHKAMEDFIQDRTVFMITHRPASVHMASRILVLESGRIVGLGCHADLLQSCIAYQKFYQSDYRRKTA
ncbi:MAG: ABC transporter ATP-binding protein [Planctomycetota bacterium]|nr:ABC transporter ATP-binding protein [Planctomycetota bacterium]